MDPQRLVFVDECEANTAMTRTYGRAPAGQRVYSDAPGRWDSITLTCGMRLGGPMAAEVFPGATNAVMFEDYVEARRRDDLGQRQTAQVGGGDRGRRGGRAQVVPLPPYSPDLTPIEEMFSKVKNVVRSVAARTTDA